MGRAACLLRTLVHYRRDLFEGALARAGFTIEDPLAKPTPDDLLLIWNRRSAEDVLARRYEAAGARVLVVENAYIGPADGEKAFAIALGAHNGAGRWPCGGPERWASWGVDLQPWRSHGEDIVLLAQRGIGQPGVAMPREWGQRTLRQFAGQPRRVVYRKHPGDKSEPYDALTNAWCACTWGSGAAIKALAAGVPVFYDFPQWIGADSARFGFANLEAPWRGDRLPMFQRLAWAMWRLSEVQSGEALEWLLGNPRTT